MRIGVISDSHGYLDLLRRAGEKLVSTHRVDCIIHLGDESADISAISNLCPLHTVPGVFEDCYHNGSRPNRVIEDFAGWKFLLSHTRERHSTDLPYYIDPEKALKEERIEVLLHGHSHIPAIEEVENALLVNPGHLKPEDRKGFPPTFAVIDLNDDTIRVWIENLENSETLFTFEKHRLFLHREEEKPS